MKRVDLKCSAANWSTFSFRQPAAVKRRVKALKKLQLQMHKVEAEFYREVHELEKKYAVAYATQFDKVRVVILSKIFLLVS